MLQILIIEDEKPVSNLIRLGLKKAGYSCVCAFDGMRAAGLLERERFDLVLLDVMLPLVDDYLVKPFEMVELLARLDAVLRRCHKTDMKLKIGD